MTKPKSAAEKRETALAAARKAGGNNEQSHWMDRLDAVIRRRAKAGKKPATR